jgi:hypothetical protein
MQTMPGPRKDGVILLELLFHDSNNAKLVISMNKQEAKRMINFDFAQIDYVSDLESITLEIDEILSLMEALIKEIQPCLNGQRILHSSIKKSLGYYSSKDYKKDNRKDLIYETLSNGFRRWVGVAYQLFDARAGIGIPSSWLYNDKDGNILLEVSPIYPWLFMKVEPGETFIKYSDWMKEYKPYVVTKIPRDSALEWLKQISKFMKKLDRSDKKYRCTGPGCAHCAKEGKSGCPCGSKLNQ